MLDINRKYYDDCTVSRVTGFGLHFMMLELPNKDNKPNVSCIPEGKYVAKKRVSPSRGKTVFEYQDVPNRTYVQIHSGNFTRQIKGCQLPGDGIKDIDKDGILDVTNSDSIMQKLLDATPDEIEVNIHS